MITINKQTQQFIQDNKEKDIHHLLLTKKLPSGVDIQMAIQQIEAKKKAKIKLPSLSSNENFIFPVKLSMEQCSSEITARYKAKIVENGKTIDITGGLGIDTIYMSDLVESMTYIEKNEKLFELAKHNFNILHKPDILCVCKDSLEFLSESEQHFDWIYVDPVRRNVHKNKVFLLQDCEPNILLHKQLFFSKANNLLVKASPMLDISQAIKELDYSVSDVHIISIRNDCKELVFVCQEKQYETPTIHCINFLNNKVQLFNFQQSEENLSALNLAEDIQTYLYEPNISILKSGAFKLLSCRFQIQKLHTNTHLYTSCELLQDFPGRIFKVKAIFSATTIAFNKYLPKRQANVSVRNFPLTVNQLKNTYKIKDGGESYLFATTLVKNRKVIILCEKI